MCGRGVCEASRGCERALCCGTETWVGVVACCVFVCVLLGVREIVLVCSTAVLGLSINVTGYEPSTDRARTNDVVVCFARGCGRH